MTGSLLVILPHNPGDVVMALQAVARIKAALPALPIDYVVGEECRELAEGSPLLHRVHILPRRRLRDALSSGDGDGLLRAVEEILARLAAPRFTHSLNLFQEEYGALLQGLVPADRKAGLELKDGVHLAVGSRYLEHLFAVPAARRDNGWHAVDVYVRAARELLDPERRLAWSPAPAASPSTGILPPLQPPVGWSLPVQKSWLAFHPGSAWPGKRWPEAHWARLSEACARAGHIVVLTGSTEEKDAVARLRARIPENYRSAIHDWSGRTDLIGAAWIHAHARRTVTGDTVAMHLAAAAGTPVLALFGPSNPVETGPYGPGHFILQAGLDLPSDLVLDREHAGLAALPAEAVAAFLLEGVLPWGVHLWETFRDDSRDAQALRDARGERHPHQSRAAGLMAHLDAGEAAAGLAGTSGAATARRDGARAALGTALHRCLTQPSSREILALESAERDLAAETTGSLVWEAYRISVNGMPLQDLGAHLQSRAARFEQALREEVAQRAGPRAETIFPRGR